MRLTGSALFLSIFHVHEYHHQNRLPLKGRANLILPIQTSRLNLLFQKKALGLKILFSPFVLGFNVYKFMGVPLFSRQKIKGTRSAFRHWGIRGITGLQACGPKDRKR